MENGKNQTDQHINGRDLDEYYFKLWKTYEKVAMHFNDLIIRLRIQSIGGLAALATILGIVLKSNNSSDESFNYGFAIIAICFLILCWIAIWNLDLRYYNRLLEGSVNAILELEKNKESFLEKKEINLSSNIERAFRQRFEHESRNWPSRILNGRNLFYLTVLSALVVILICTIVLCYRDCRQLEIKSGTSTQVQKVLKNKDL